MADSATEGGSEQDDISFLRTNDIVCLSCVTSSRDSSTTDRVCLSAEGFGNRMCCLENVSSRDTPPDISVCSFVLEQALSVRALQEMVTSSSQDSTDEGPETIVSAAQSGHRTLLYGHAVLLRHLHSNMYLSCLSTSSSNDKLAFDVGLDETAQGEACWWTIHPASKQRSEGEKVRVGDDLILVSVSSERYLHIGGGSMVIASFQQTLWTVVPICSGGIRNKCLGYVFGGDVIRLFHGHMDECFAIPEAGSENEFSAVMYETGAVCSHARSLWRIEIIRTKWAGGFIGWGQQCRLRHVTSGRYLAVTNDNLVVTVHRQKAEEQAVAFFLFNSKDDKKKAEGREDEGMGKSDIKYGDSMVFIQHCATGRWLSYQTYETKKRGVGKLEVKKAVMLLEGHMDDGFTFSRAQEEESRSARVIRKCQSIFNRFNKALDSLKTEGRSSYAWGRISLSEVLKCLEDLIDYFAQPEEDEEHEEKQNKLRALRNRQDLFQEEGMIALILETIDKFIQYKSRRHFAHYAGEEAASKWDGISSYLYLLLAAMIRGNRANCAQFAQSYRLDWLVNRLESQQSSTGVLDVLHCVLIDSPEALNMIKEKHIVTIISLIDRAGRDPKVLGVLRSLCVGSGVAVRTNQNLICDNLLPGRDLLLQTKLVDHVASIKPNIYVGVMDGSAMYKKWYFELVVIQFESATHLPPVLRVGVANSAGFVPYPGSGEQWGGNAVGDDLYSYAFDGVHLWTGGKPKQVRVSGHQLEHGDVIGCCLDLSIPQISFTLNGIKVRGIFKDFNLDGLFTPVVSMSARVSCRFVFGGDHGKFKFDPPEGHSPAIEALLPKEKLHLDQCFWFGDIHRNVICGPTEVEYSPFVPKPVDTANIQLPAYIENVRDRLAENLHEIWCASKIEQGWSYGEVRDDQRKKNPAINNFEKVPMTEKKYVITVSYETLRTLLALGYHISMDNQKKENNRLKTLKLPNNFLQNNGYKPTPLDLSSVTLNELMEDLVDLLAENTHNVWAKDRIKHGWTYGMYEDLHSKRSPHLVPYNKVDDAIKKANRDQSNQTVKTLLAYGYNIEPPTSETGESAQTALSRALGQKKSRTRTYRTQLTYAVSSGKWYYEFEVLTPGFMKVGWAKVGAKPCVEIGMDGSSYAFDGLLGRKWHYGAEQYGKIWHAGDIIGCMLDLNDRTCTFSLNGELMMDNLGQEIAFRGIDISDGYVPAMTLALHQQAKLNFGQDVNTLKYFTCCGLQEGFEPFCVNMTRRVPLWYGKDLPLFESIDDSHPSLQVQRIPGGAHVTPCLKILSKTFGTLEKVHLEYLRLSLPVKCKEEFIQRDRSSGYPSNFERKMNLENIRRHEMDIEEEQQTPDSLPENYSEAMSDVSIGGSKMTTESVRKMTDSGSPSSSGDGRKTSSHNETPSRQPNGDLQSPTTSHDDDEDEYSPDGILNENPAKSLERGYTEDLLPADQRRKKFLRPHGQGHSLDDSSQDDREMNGLKSAASESQLSVPADRQSSSRLSLLGDKLIDTAKAIGEKGTKRSKNTFSSIFKKKGRDLSPAESKRTRSVEYGSLDRKQGSSFKRFRDKHRHDTSKGHTLPTSQTMDSVESDNGQPSQGPVINIEAPRGMIPYEFQDAMGRRQNLSRDFGGSEGSDHSDGDFAELSAMADVIEEYQYSIRILPGQDPAQVFVGWVTPGFHFSEKTFETKKVRHVILSVLDDDYNLKQSLSRKNCYMVSAGDLLQRYGSSLQEVTSKRSTPGLVIGCSIDISTGMLSFSVNGKEVANKFQVEPNTKLFPAVICEPTIKEMFQFELGYTRFALPLSAAVFRGPKNVIPSCPPRLDVQTLSDGCWSRVPEQMLSIHSLKLSGVRGWSMLCDHPVSMMVIYIPEEDRSLDILELIEHQHLLDFHAKTLQLYQAVCSHGNHRVANALTYHVDERLLMYCVQSENLAGPLRTGYHNLLITMHLESHATARLLTQNEFIIPLTSSTKDLKLYRRTSVGSDANRIKDTIPNMDDSVSIRPQLAISEKEIETRVKTAGKDSTAPYFPVETLKTYVMQALKSAVIKGADHIRDPIGGSNDNLFVPLLKVCDSLLVMGRFNDDDLLNLLTLINPQAFDDESDTGCKKGLLQMKLDDAVKLEVCHILQHLCDIQLRHRVESIVAFSDNFVHACQNDQLKRYIDIKQADLPSAVTARMTREFRCPPHEQMRNLLIFKSAEEDENGLPCPCGQNIRNMLWNFHSQLLTHCAMPAQLEPEEKSTETDAKAQPATPTVGEKLLQLVWNTKEEDKTNISQSKEKKIDNLQKLIQKTAIEWGQEDFIVNQELVREMFSLLYRQYNGIGELLSALEKAYVISNSSKEDINILLRALGNIRSLLLVQAGRDEEDLMKNSLKELMDNKVFFQHPDLMRALCVHETVMQLMVNTLNKAQQQQQSTTSGMPEASQGRRGSLTRRGSFNTGRRGSFTLQQVEQTKDAAAEMVVMCCRFLCYFCRTSRQNQRAMFEHLSYLLENSSMLLARPSLRGSCPLDVAYSSLMDNNELALALREANLEKIAMYLSRCGVQSNAELLEKGYPDIGWDPVEGERFLDFLRFCVWVNGESVEENANLVVRLLIRRPECLGPALRGEGGGLYKAIKDGIKMSQQIITVRDSNSAHLLSAMMDDDSDGRYLYQSKYDFQTLPPEDDEDYIDMGGAILNFYAGLVDLLGRCAPDAETIKSGRSDSVRARAILRSLVSMEDLEKVLGLSFILPSGPTMSADTESQEGEDGGTPDSDMPPGLNPAHKSSVMLFLERVYGIPDQETFFRILEEGVLPDLRAATTLDTATASESDFALALNRYIGGSVLPLLTRHSHFFENADHASTLLDSTLNTVYRLSKCRSLTKGQMEAVSEFLISFTNQLRPPMMTGLLRKLTVDVPNLNENTIVPLRVLTAYYKRCGSYYSSGGWGSYGSATDEEKRLTMILFSGIFDSLSHREYDPELFSKALPCLSAIGCALSPDYSLTKQDDKRIVDIRSDLETAYNPQPLDTRGVSINQSLDQAIGKFAEHFHDVWSLRKIDCGWSFGTVYDDDRMTHPLLKPYHLLDEKAKNKYILPAKESVLSMLVWGWALEQDQQRQAANRDSMRRRMSKDGASHGYSPKPFDLRNMTLTREIQNMADKLSKDSHDTWAWKKRLELEEIGGGIHPLTVPYDTLTDKEKKRYRDHATELLKFLQFQGFRISSNDSSIERHTSRASDSRRDKGTKNESEGNVSATEKRFAYSLLEKLLQYFDNASTNMTQTRPSSRFSRRESYSTATGDVKFFGKVVLPFVEKYFAAHREYFVGSSNSVGGTALASVKEKEMTANLFCKLAQALRGKINAFGHDVCISVRCLQVLIQAVDARSVVKNSPEMVRSSLMPFFNNAADDLAQVVENLMKGRFSHVKGTITRGATSLDYVHMVLLPVLSSMFDHLGRNHFGPDLIVGDIQLAAYRILNSLYSLGTASSSIVERETILSELSRHRPALGECLGSFACCFPVAFLEPSLNKYNRNSILFGIEGKISEHSLEAQEVMDQLKECVPELEKIITEIEELAESGGKYQEAPHVIEVTLPMLCSYLPFWLAQGKMMADGSNKASTVTEELMNTVLKNVLKLILSNIGTLDAPWMNRIATRTQPIIASSTPDMIKDHFLPIAVKLRQNGNSVEQKDKKLLASKHGSNEIADLEAEVQTGYCTLVRDIYAFYPLLIKYVDLHRSQWLKNPTPEAEELFTCVADIFGLWSKSLMFKREEQNFVMANEIDNMALIMPSQSKSVKIPQIELQAEASAKKTTKRREKKRLEPHNSLNVACLKRLLPIGLGFFSGREQELLQQAKQKLIDESEADIEDFLLKSLEVEEGPTDEAVKWQKVLYRKIGGSTDTHLDQNKVIDRILSMAKVMHGLHTVEHPSASHKSAWRKVISTQRKRAVMACFRMIPLHSLPRHRAINLFLKCYKSQWLDTEEYEKKILIEDVTKSDETEDEGEKKEIDEELKPDPLTQLITCLSRAATKEQQGSLPEDPIYMSYAQIMGQSCHGEDEDDDEDDGGGDEDGPGSSFQEQEMEKQQLLFEQSRLADRGAAEMVLLYISACRGVQSSMVTDTIELGISLLRGGNTEVQKNMLNHLKEKKDVGFFTSLSGLMQSCSVLDLDAFERTNKAEGLGMSSDANASETNLHDAEITCKLFRFLQLLCEGHNAEFQNYLRTQAGNNTTVNVVICTVDYLLRLQESIMDFYWHYSGKDTIDQSGKESFCRAIMVAKQIFRSLTEYIQGPCVLNQLALAHSRLWDAVGGFLYIFAHMQDKLSKDCDQLELLREFMKLQKEMMIMLLSMLEGNVMNGPIGKQMVDTLVESSANVEMILKFFDIFLKMKDLTSSEAFLEFDTNKDGYISAKEFRKAMEGQKMYSREEIDYIMMCVDANQDGKVDFNEFTDRFHNPAKDIGFTMAVLLTNLSEHMPSDPRLERFLEKARSVLDYFGPYLGRIEIMGSSNKIERVYFEIKQSHIDQWEKPQIKESKRSFLHSVVNEGGDKEKLESFVNFCEDTIFEMQHATSISAEEQRLAAMRSGAGVPGEGGILEPITTIYRFASESISTGLSLLTWSNIKSAYQTFKKMTYWQLFVTVLKLNFRLALLLLTFLFNIMWTLIKFVLNMMKGEKEESTGKTQPVILALLPPPSNTEKLFIPTVGIETAETFGISVKKDNEEESSLTQVSDGNVDTSEKPKKITETPSTEDEQLAETISEWQPTFDNNSRTSIKANIGENEELPYETKSFDWGKYVLSLFARNFYNFKYAALILAFVINVMLLFYKVTRTPVEGGEDDSNDDSGNVTEAVEDIFDEIVVMESDIYFREYMMQILAICHSIISFSMLIAYYCLKVPLVIFKREKEIARKLEFEGLWVAEQPGDDDIKAHWDKLVLSTQSFPESYWDKFVKKKVRARYAEQYDYEAISNLLGMDKGDSIKLEEEQKSNILPSFLNNVDWQYQIWKWGVIFTDNSFLYIAWYFIFSVFGNNNYFFFAAHLLDVAIAIPALRTILQSVTHNGKQLVLTVMLTSVVVYIYTVIAFNFFRKFYIKEDDGNVDYKCHDMLTCFVYHLHTGVRAGGGIGDEIEPADGDAYEVYRILFDITFFFFVIVILLAIIQGLIIDAFGELRDQLEQVKEDMESKCFICGIGKEYFDKVPHGFETHVTNEHNFANYMFFLMHLINKPDTEYTGQETYVWELYQQRCWDFFPVGDCFRKQYEDEAVAKTEK